MTEKIRIEIVTRNAAFDELEAELVTILRKLADDIERGRIDPKDTSEPRAIRDTNGNQCGIFAAD